MCVYIDSPSLSIYSETAPRPVQAGEPHPCAPDDIVKVFADFGKKPIGAKPSPSSSTTSSSSTSSTTTTSQQQQRTPQPSSSSSSKLPPPDFEEFFQAPRRLWQQPMLEDAEMEAIMVRGTMRPFRSTNR